MIPENHSHHSFPFPGVLNSLRYRLRSILNSRACTSQRVSDSLTRAACRTGDGTANASPSGSSDSTQGASDSADRVTKCGCDKFGGSSDALVLV